MYHDVHTDILNQYVIFHENSFQHDIYQSGSIFGATFALLFIREGTDIGIQK